MEKILEFIKANKVYFIVTGLTVFGFIVAIIFLVTVLSGDSVPVGNTDLTEETAAQTEPEETEPAEEVYVPFEKRSNGIDVSKWQGDIDWKKVKESGIYFAFIRVGYRGENGQMYEDEKAAYNLREAEKNGILIGVYYFSTAVNEKEALEEAEWVLDYIEGYSISYPVVYDCEGFVYETSRMHKLTAAERTDNAIAFLDRIAEEGYDTMHYGARSELMNSDYWDMSRIEEKHKVWVAIYTKILYPFLDKPNYNGRIDAWQYSNVGKVGGIETDVDLVVCYFVCDKERPKDPDKPPAETVIKIPETDEPEEVYHGVKFTSVNDKVTAKIVVNLRSHPTTEDENVVGELKKGDFLERTAISEQGWSRLIYNGQAVYAISGYLTTSVEETDGTRPPEQYYFDNIDDKVTAKIETNLRTAPTTSGSEVVYTLKNGEYLRRTGINVATGWSRLEYNGQTVYAISSYLMREGN